MLSSVGSYLYGSSPIVVCVSPPGKVLGAWLNNSKATKSKPGVTVELPIYTWDPDVSIGAYGIRIYRELVTEDNPFLPVSVRKYEYTSDGYGDIYYHPEELRLVLRPNLPLVEADAWVEKQWAKYRNSPLSYLEVERQSMLASVWKYLKKRPQVPQLLNRLNDTNLVLDTKTSYALMHKVRGSVLALLYFHNTGIWILDLDNTLYPKRIAATVPTNLIGTILYGEYVPGKKYDFWIMDVFTYRNVPMKETLTSRLTMAQSITSEYDDIMTELEAKSNLSLYSHGLREFYTRSEFYTQVRSLLRLQEGSILEGFYILPVWMEHGEGVWHYWDGSSLMNKETITGENYHQLLEAMIDTDAYLCSLILGIKVLVVTSTLWLERHRKLLSSRPELEVTFITEYDRDLLNQEWDSVCVFSHLLWEGEFNFQSRRILFRIVDEYLLTQAMRPAINGIVRKAAEYVSSKHSAYLKWEGNEFQIMIPGIIEDTRYGKVEDLLSPTSSLKISNAPGRGTIMTNKEEWLSRLFSYGYVDV